MDEFELREELDLLRFQIGLLFENTEFTRFLYECKITRTEARDLVEKMEEYRDIIDNGGKVTSSKIESDFYATVPRLYGDYHFCESYTQLCWEDDRFEEVFESAYGKFPKFKDDIARKKNREL